MQNSGKKHDIFFIFSQLTVLVGANIIDIKVILRPKEISNEKVQKKSFHCLLCFHLDLKQTLKLFSTFDLQKYKIW